MLSNLDELKTIHREKEKLAVREAELMQPVESDFTLLPLLYRWFCELNDVHDFACRSGSVKQRNKFILIILRIYSPQSFIGEKMTRGLRDKLVEVLQLHSRTIISNTYGDQIFYYRQYQDYRQEVNILYEEMVARLEQHKTTQNETRPYESV